VNLHGDSKLTVQKLLPLLKQKEDSKWRDTIESNMKEWWQVMESRAMHDANPINPQRLFWEVSDKLPHNVIFTCDSGSSANWYARDLKVRKGMRCSLSGGLATMCPGVPYAIAAKYAFPEKPVIAFVGDGAMQMLGNDGLVTISRAWKEWDNPQLIIVVLNNRDLNQVTWEQRVMNGDPKFPASQDLPAMSYAKFAEILGLEGIEVFDPGQIGPVWDIALSADRPVVIDAHTDPDVPPLPPHITFEQAKGFMFSMFEGDPNIKGMIKQSAKEMMSNLLAHSK
jgi:pyruvate dehydrogenase (quinone)